MTPSTRVAPTVPSTPTKPTAIGCFRPGPTTEASPACARSLTASAWPLPARMDGCGWSIHIPATRWRPWCVTSCGPSTWPGPPTAGCSQARPATGSTSATAPVRRVSGTDIQATLVHWPGPARANASPALRTRACTCGTSASGILCGYWNFPARRFHLPGTPAARHSRPVPRTASCTCACRCPAARRSV